MTSRLQTPAGVDVEGLILETEFLLLLGTVCSLLRLSTDWMRPTNIMEGNLLYSESIMSISSKKIPSQQHLDLCEQATEHYSPARLTHKINQHKHPQDTKHFSGHWGYNSELHR